MEEQEYVPRTHSVEFRGIGLLGNRLSVKMYSMVPEGMRDLHPSQVNSIMTHIDREIIEGHIDPRLGLGFLIASEGIANLSLWGGKYPSLLNQTVYSFNPQTVSKTPNFKKESLDKFGTFCCWELGVVAHEGAAWRRYLLSSQSSKDEGEYLKDRFTGLIGR